jgi:hypothetical protein
MHFISDPNLIKPNLRLFYLSPLSWPAAPGLFFGSYWLNSPSFWKPEGAWSLDPAD